MGREWRQHATAYLSSSEVYALGIIILNRHVEKEVVIRIDDVSIFSLSVSGFGLGDLCEAFFRLRQSLLQKVNGRVYIWDSAICEFIQVPQCFGAGHLLVLGVITTQRRTTYQQRHNIFLSSSHYFGLAGLLILIIQRVHAACKLNGVSLGYLNVGMFAGLLYSFFVTDP